MVGTSSSRRRVQAERHLERGTVYHQPGRPQMTRMVAHREGPGSGHYSQRPNGEGIHPSERQRHMEPGAALFVRARRHAHVRAVVIGNLCSKE